MAGQEPDSISTPTPTPAPTPAPEPKVCAPSVIGPSSTNTTQVHLRVLIISGESHVFSFGPETTVGRMKELIWIMWPSGEFWFLAPCAQLWTVAALAWAVSSQSTSDSDRAKSQGTMFAGCFPGQRSTCSGPRTWARRSPHPTAQTARRLPPGAFTPLSQRRPAPPHHARPLPPPHSYADNLQNGRRPPSRQHRLGSASCMPAVCWATSPR
jgi:hypothetical protein